MERTSLPYGCPSKQLCSVRIPPYTILEQIIVISDEVYKYMVYSGLNGSAETAERNGSNSPNGGSQPITVEGTSVGEGVDTAGRDAGTGRVQGGAEGGRDILPEGKMERGAKQPLPALRHVHFATLPGMWDRTITISSAGKTFSVTGWQVRCSI